MALYERQWKLALEVESPSAEVRAAHSLAALHHRLGRLAEAREYHQRGQERAEVSGDRFGEVYLIDDFVEVLLLLGEEDAARDLASRMRSVAHEMKDACAQGFALHRAATVEEQNGHGELARRLVTEALEVRRARNEPLEIAASLVLLARIEAAADRPAQAERALAEALELTPPDDPDAQLTAELARLELGLPSADATRVRSLLDARRSLMDVNVRMCAHHALWRVSGDARDLAEAKRLLDHLLAHAPEAYRGAMREAVGLHACILSDAREQKLDA
jgi:tetratricopeptide (TPR) repeat protein